MSDRLGPTAEPAPAAPRAPATAHEQPYVHPSEAVEFDREIQYHQLIWMGVALLGIALVSAVLVFFMLRGFVHWRAATQTPPPVMAPVQQEVPGPKLLARPERELARVRQEENERLSTYGWVDTAAGVARIPVERAIDLVAAQGLPAAAPAASPAAVPGVAPAPTAAPAAATIAPAPTPAGAPH
ncbi:MAG TPA: hypothetical protein VGV61_12395 [Thermoanaerobaculia bacterium]|jgi:hypothetical protein|nr:hypothetical protein [Thermoanaerobaculia bacterium]